MSEEKVIAYYFPSGFDKEAEMTYRQLQNHCLDVSWGEGEFDERGYRATVIMLPRSQISCLQIMQKANPASFGNEWSEDRPERVPANGHYWFRAYEGDARKICQVTDDRVKFPHNPKGVPHQFLGHAVIFDPIKFEDFRQPDEVYLIKIKDGQTVGFLRNMGDPLPMPYQVLDAYSKEYAIPRSDLWWGIARLIPMPTIEGFND